MKEVQDYPKEGQFVAVWEYNDKIWSETYEWRDGALCVFMGEFFDLVEKFENLCWVYDENCEKKFFVIK